MRLKIIENTLAKLSALIASGRFEELETDTLEIKPVPSDSGSWNERYRSACAFLNTRGGILILGVKEERQGAARKYVFTGWQSHGEPKLKEMPKQFADHTGRALDLSHAFPPPEIRDFMGGKIAVQLIDELPADDKYVFFGGEAYRRLLTGDHKISAAEIERQREYQEEALHARELQPVNDVGIHDLDLDKLNEYITQLNRPAKIETIKADMESARPFLERKSFVKEGRVTTLGMLVCGQHPADRLGFRCQVHGYVDVPAEVAQDKQDLADNILPLMEGSLAYLIRNIQVGVSIEQGGTRTPQYPEELLRETVNNALAHRDYAINRHVIMVIKPGQSISIRNPGGFRKHLLVEAPSSAIPLRRILPEAKPRNPKLADVLRVFRKWEGRGIGMATLVNLSLENKIDLPYYLLGKEEVALHLYCGALLDERMERLFQSFDAYIEQKTNGLKLTQTQKLVLAYLIKSEWANEQARYTILLSPDNNHFSELNELDRLGLIGKHECSTANYPVYVVDRVLLRKDYVNELRGLFGSTFDALDQLSKDVLGIVYRFNNYSKARLVSAKAASFNLWHSGSHEGGIKEFDSFYRQVRRSFVKLQKQEFLSRQPGTRGYLLAEASAGPTAL